MSGLQEIGTEVPPGAVVVHEPHGFVHLVECNADDLMVVNAARVSFRKRSEWVDQIDYARSDDGEIPFVSGVELSDTDEKMLRFLMSGKHGTPFEHNFFTFHVRAPIFLFREWHRHRIGISINEESGRYVQLKDDFYLPDDEHVRVQQGKPGAYVFVPCGREVMPSDERHKSNPGGVTYGEEARSLLDNSYDTAYETYERLMEMGVAKEIARACLPVGIYSQMYWSCNARSLMNFLALRNHNRALYELRDYAAAMEKIFAEKMPVTHDAFVKNGRVAP